MRPKLIATWRIEEVSIGVWAAREPWIHPVTPLGRLVQWRMDPGDPWRRRSPEAPTCARLVETGPGGACHALRSRACWYGADRVITGRRRSMCMRRQLRPAAPLNDACNLRDLAAAIVPTSASGRAPCDLVQKPLSRSRITIWPAWESNTCATSVDLVPVGRGVLETILGESELGELPA